MTAPLRYLPLVMGLGAREIGKLQGCAQLAVVGVRDILDAARTFLTIDGQGDRIRRQIQYHENQAYGAARVGDLGGVIGHLHKARGLWPLYEQADADEGFHVGRILTIAGGIVAALKRVCLIARHFLTGEPLSVLERQYDEVELVDAAFCEHACDPETVHALTEGCGFAEIERVDDDLAPAVGAKS